MRVGSFFPSLLEPRRRVDRALWAVIMTAYMTGTSTRKVDDLVRALGLRVRGVEVDGVADLRRDRRRGRGVPQPAASITRHAVRVSWTPPTSRPGINHRIVSRAVVVATGVTVNGDREVLGVDVGDCEDEVFWTAFLRGLKDRGLTGCAW